MEFLLIAFMIGGEMYTKIKLILISLLSVILISSASFARDLVITFDDMNPGPKAAFENAIAKFQKEKKTINLKYKKKHLLI